MCSSEKKDSWDDIPPEVIDGNDDSSEPVVDPEIINQW